MLYRDLIQFTPIETIIQLREADKEAVARNLVQTYVISDPMASKLVDRALAQLQFERPQDNKGVLIVGNYGTGKSHLMSVLSAIAERGELRQFLTNSRVKEAALCIAGKFKVVRVEIGGVTRGLREILLDELQVALQSWGVNFSFPAADQISNNKNALIQAVDAFQQQYPGMGILLVVDELLDYLRTREQRALILDLGFLRELGEVAASCSFRFMGGLQETLFENPRFNFVADQLRRVKDRFEQINIAHQDITFVVTERLLKKTDTQKALIADHLRRFSGLYKSMAERMDEFVALFPIHPSYVETFQNLAIAEKRQVLKAFSTAMHQVLDQELPNQEPGLISYDQYWGLIQEDPALRSMDDIARVIEKSRILEGLIQNSYTRPNLKDMALRIIRALSVQRLTTSDIFLPLGVTAEGLRDGLCLYLRLPEEMNTAEFLLDQVQVALKEMMKTVQGQFLSHNPENGQYYLDLKKAVDFEQKIRERGDIMDRSDLNTYFYDALRQALNLSDSTYLTGYSIWFYELPWMEHKVNRPGYFFFGLPDERTTAQPPRDFYLYFLPPFLTRPWNDRELPDEVAFSLSGLDAEFEEQIRLYAGARAMANESTEYRTEYANKADNYFKRLMNWLQQRLVEKLHVFYQGVDEPVQAILTQMRSTANQNLEELIRSVSSHLLAPQFEDRYPDYPTFARLKAPVTDAGRANTAMEAIRCLCGRRTNLGMDILEGLGMLDAHTTLRPLASPYARYFLQQLTDKAERQVVNRGEVIEQVAGGVQPLEKDLRFHLEPEWVVVLLLALVQQGEIVLNLDGREELDASTLERALTRSMSDLVNFRFYKRPQTMPLHLWVSIFEGLELQAGLIRDENTRERAVEELQRRVGEDLKQVTELDNQLKQGLRFWNVSIFTNGLTFVAEEGRVVDSNAPAISLSSTEFLPGLRGYKQFLEELAKYTTVGKLRNLHTSLTDIQEHLEDRQRVQRAQQLVRMIAQLQSYATYLVGAQANLPADHPWLEHSRQVCQQVLDGLRTFGRTGSGFDLQAAERELVQLKKDYIAAYSELHRRLVLSSSGDQARQRLYSDARFNVMSALTKIELFERNNDFNLWKQNLTGLPSCREFHEDLLSEKPTCSCGLRPVQQTTMVQADAFVQQMDAQLSDLLSNWRQALRNSLQSPTAQTSLQAMSPAERQPIEEFLRQRDDAEELPNGFVAAATQALRGIQALVLPVAELLQALKQGGMPCTRQDFQQRFVAFLERQMRGYDSANTRLALDE